MTWFLNVNSLNDSYLQNRESIFYVEQVSLCDEQKVPDMPRLQGGVRPRRGPVSQAEERRQEAAEGADLLQERVLFGVVAAVLHKVADHVGVATVVEADDRLWKKL